MKSSRRRLCKGIGKAEVVLVVLVVVEEEEEEDGIVCVCVCVVVGGCCLFVEGRKRRRMIWFN